ncbi:hypothetical protein ACOSQ2_009364 [Xanthoceras sorbifolium]
MSGNKRALDFPSSSSKGQKLSLSSSSCSNSQWKYDVFLSFRGEDTRNNFTDHLYAALYQKGIYTFRDDERLERGKEISPELLEAIESSRFSVIILSKNYASSSCCLEELAKIVECMDTKIHTVLPIFYDVDPSDVRKQSGDFKTAFDKHEQDCRDNMEKVERWRSALIQVDNLAGWHLQDGSEAKLIKKIVFRILGSLNGTFENVTRDLVGMNSHVEKIYELLKPEKDDIRFIGIWGMGGVGKSTIAKVVFEMLSYQYKGKCFLKNVREVSKEKGVVFLQNELLSDILNEKNLNICNDLGGINYIRRRLCCKRVFVVLDDVDNQLEQLEKLAGKPNWFGPGSRIILTTRHKHVLTSHEISSIYEVKGLEDHDALQLFHMKAFKNKQPPVDFADLSMKIIDYAKGLPLAIQVLGFYLCGRTVEEWKSVLNRLRRVSQKDIFDTLRISYDGLEETEKKMFLDIACFFKGMNKGRVTEILDSCDFDSIIGIRVLADRSLITISNNEFGVIDMHDLLQEMGWKIVREQHPDDRGKWSRLWLFEDVHHVLTKNRGTHEVKGIMLNKSEQRLTHVDGKSFSNMRNLRLLKISNVDLSEELQYLSDELRFLTWTEYPSSSLPLNFQPLNLFELNLCHSRMKYLWKGMKVFLKLKTIKLSHSHYLIETPDFKGVPNLEKLDLEDCSRLCKVHETVGSLERLTILNLKGCKNLKSFPSKVSGLKSLKIFNLHGCSKLDELPQNLGELQCLEELDASGTAIKQVPDSIARLTNLKTLSLRDCRQAPPNWISSLWLPRKIPSSMCLVLPSLIGLFSLKILDFSDCNLLEGALPDDLGSLCSLAELKLSNNNFVSLPKSINQLSKLEILCLEKCQMLKSIPELPPKTTFVGADDCTSLEDVSNMLKHLTSEATSLHFVNCSKLLEDQGQENSLAVMLLKQYIQQQVNLSPLFYIPKWFSYKVDGDSVIVGLPSNWVNDEFKPLVYVDTNNLDAMQQKQVNLSCQPKRLGRRGLRGVGYCVIVGLPSNWLNAEVKPLAYVATNNHYAMLRQQVNLSRLFHIRLPGREIPKWFSCKGDGDSVIVGLPSNWLNDEFMGIAVCGVISPGPEKLDDILSVYCKMNVMSTSYSFFFDILPFTAVESEHLWLAYATREMFEHDGSDNFVRYLNYLQTSSIACIHARFSLISSTGAKKSNSKVIECGIRPVYKKDVECFQESPPAEGSILPRSHNCSVTGCWDKFPTCFVPAKLQHSYVSSMEKVMR